jgi:ribosomal protein S18 acetylase RimI-like enzyme
MHIKVLEIDVSKTYSLRHALLRKGKALESCFFPNDTSEKTIHLGAFESEQLIGILSAYPKDCPDHNHLEGVQFRAIAVAPSHQRKGVASNLIQHAIKIVEEKLHPDFIWLNARIEANSLYQSNGFKSIGAPFEIESIGTHQRFLKPLNNDT